MKDGPDYEALLQAVQKEAEAAVGVELDQVHSEQVEAFERYTGQLYGDEQLGRSQVVTREVFEVIEWLRPDIARMFGSGGRAVEIEPWAQGSEQDAEGATDYLNHAFFERQDGHAIIDSFFFDGALQKIGVAGVYWEDAQMDEPETYERMHLVQAVEMASDPNIDVLEGEAIYPDGMDAESGVDPDAARMVVQRVRQQAKPYVEVIAPEDFLLKPRTVDLQNARYCGRIVRTSKAELKLLFPERVDLIDEYADASRDTMELDERRSSRFFDEDSGGHEIGSDDADDDVILYEEYIYFDLDGDDYEELLEVKRLQGCILSAEPVDEHPFAAWSPIRIPHRLIGLSIADIAKDIQRTKTVLLRSALDSVYQSVAPRMGVIESKVNLADLLTVRPGGVIRMKDGVQRVGDALMPVAVPDMAGSAMAMMEWIDQAAEARTGVTRHAQGLDPDSLNKTATGIKLMQNAASTRKEMIARNFASGLETLFRKYFRLLVRNQDRPQSVRIGKEWKTYTPSTWGQEARVRVHVGHGTGDRETQIGQLMMLLGLQEKVVATLGVANPIVTPKHMHRTMEHIARVMGFRTVDQFFADPSELNEEQKKQLLTPPPNPDVEKIEAQMQARQIKAQADQQKAAMGAQQEQAETAANIQLKREQMQADIQLKREQLVAEMQMRREIEMEKIRAGAYAPRSSSVRLGGRPG